MTALRISDLLQQKALQALTQRTISSTLCCSGKLSKYALRRKPQRRSGTSVLVKTPDWSYIDGRPAPPGSQATRRMEMQRRICERIIQLNDDIAQAEEQGRHDFDNLLSTNTAER